MKKSQQKLTEYTVLLGVMLLFAFIYHFDVIKSGFDLLPGDGGDSLLNILAADSWQDVFNGETAFRQNRIYYPFAVGRGFTDLSLTLYLAELPWRWIFKMDMYQSAAAVYTTLWAVGMISMFYLLRKIVHLDFLPSLAGAVMAFYCNACYVKLLHTQFFFIGLLPLLAIFMIRYCQYWRSKHNIKRILCGIGAILTFAWIAYSNFYTVFFAGLSGGIYFIIYGTILFKNGKLKQLFIPARLVELAILLLFGIIVFAPFFYTYLPLLTADYERNWTAAQGTSPTLADIVNIGPDNLLWGRLYEFAFPPIHKYVYENYHGLPLLTCAVTAFCLWQFWKKRKEIRPVYISLLLMMIVLYGLSVKFAHGVSLWYFIWKYVPGGSSIRAVGRIYVFMMFPLMIFIWWTINRYVKRFAPGKRMILSVVLFALLALDNFNTMPICQWRRSESVAKMKNTAPPPEDMKCFYLTDSKPGGENDENWGRYGFLAWQMARYFKSFTINGCSGNMPAGFTAINPCAKDYQNSIEEWIKKNKLSGVYSYNIPQNKWTAAEIADN